MRAGADGSVRWSRLYGTNPNDRFASVSPTDDGGFLAAGVSVDRGDAHFVRVDENGDPLWERSLDLGAREAANVVRATPDGSFVAAGESTVSRGSGRAPIVTGWIARFSGDAAVACAD
jgi:hypothetical protein